MGCNGGICPCYGRRKAGLPKEGYPLYDGEKASVWEHLKRSIDFVYQNIGTHGLPLMLHSD